MHWCTMTLLIYSAYPALCAWFNRQALYKDEQWWATRHHHWQMACRDNKAKLMGRQWIIQDDKGKVVDQVAGPGRQLYNCMQQWTILGCCLDRLNRAVWSANSNYVNLYVCTGVVGNTPLLKPYDCFQYYSSAMLESMQGAMHGSFQMLRTDSASQQEFDANIQPFRLIASR